MFVVAPTALSSSQLSTAASKAHKTVDGVANRHGAKFSKGCWQKCLQIQTMTTRWRYRTAKLNFRFGDCYRSSRAYRRVCLGKSLSQPCFSSTQHFRRR